MNFSTKLKRKIMSQWKSHDSNALYFFDNVTSQFYETFQEKTLKLIAIDMDGTLIKTKSGRPHPKDETDWLFWSPEVITTLQNEDFDSSLLVIATNQSGTTKKDKREQILTKIENIMNALKLEHRVTDNIIALVASGYSRYRKPSTGMWDFVEEYLQVNHQITVDHQRSFYVGDAAGRPEEWKKGKKKDWSCCDRQLALNLGINFYTPEEYFLKEKPVTEFDLGFSPQDYLNSITKKRLVEQQQEKIDELFRIIESNSNDPSKVTFIMMIGPPASGKSTFCKKYLLPMLSSNTTYINQDTLKTKNKCIDATTKNLIKMSNIVIDNTNPSKKIRHEYLELPNRSKVRIIGVWFNISKKVSQHNNTYRGRLNQRQVPNLAIAMYYSKFEPPTLDEGFDDIIELDFIPEFESEQQEQLYLQYST